jgi:hypothetical protein
MPTGWMAGNPETAESRARSRVAYAFSNEAIWVALGSEEDPQVVGDLVRRLSKAWSSRMDKLSRVEDRRWRVPSASAWKRATVVRSVRVQAESVSVSEPRGCGKVAWTWKVVSLVMVSLKAPEVPKAAQETESGRRMASTGRVAETVEVSDLGPVLSFWQERSAIIPKRGTTTDNRARTELGMSMGLYLGAMGSNSGMECRTLEELKLASLDHVIAPCESAPP